MAIGRLEFEKKLKENINPTPKEFQLIMLAYRLAKYGHKGQVRDDGKTRYFEHPKGVALILIEENTLFRIVKPRQIITALLHDIKEDSFILTWEDIELIFGKRIRKSIEIMSKDKTLSKGLREEIHFKKLAAASAEDKDNKLADRLHNMRDLQNCSPEKQEEYVQETINFFLPLAKKNNGIFYNLLKKECEKYTNKELP